MSFGLCNALICFKHLMEQVLEGLQWKAALVYLDDVLVFRGIFEEELSWQEDMLHRLRVANLMLSPKKYTLFKYEVLFLGHMVRQKGVYTDPLKVMVVADSPVDRCEEFPLSVLLL